MKSTIRLSCILLILVLAVAIAAPALCPAWEPEPEYEWECILAVEHDLLNNRIERREYFYALNGAMTGEIIYRNGKPQEYSYQKYYDAQGREVREEHYDEELGKWQTFRTYAYDAAGNLAEECSYYHEQGKGKTLYDYDSAGRLLEERTYVYVHLRRGRQSPVARRHRSG